MRLEKKVSPIEILLCLLFSFLVFFPLKEMTPVNKTVKRFQRGPDRNINFLKQFIVTKELLCV